MFRKPFAIAVIALLAFSASACGRSAPEETDRSQIKQLVADYFDALAAGDGKEVCARLNGDQQRWYVSVISQIDASVLTCVDAARVSSGLVGPDEIASYKDADQLLDSFRIIIDGRRATIKTKRGVAVLVLTEYRGTGWLISNLWPGGLPQEL